MESTNVMAAQANENQYITNRTIPANIIVAVLFFCVGIILFILSGQTDPQIQWTAPALITGAIAAITIGIIRLVSGMRKPAYVGTGSLVRSEHLHFGSGRRPDLMKALDTKDYKIFSTLRGSSGTGMRLSISYSSDGKYAAVKLYEYIPHQYVPTTETYHFMDEDAERLIKSLIK